MDLKRKADRYGLVGTITFHFLLLLVLLFMGKSCTDIKADPLDGGVEVSLGEPDFGGPDQSTAENPAEHIPEETVEKSQVTSDVEDAPEVQEIDPSPPRPKPTVTPSQTTPTPEPRRPNTRDLFGGSDNSGRGSGSGEISGQQGNPDGSPDGQPDGTGHGSSGEGFSGDGFSGKIDGFKAVGTYKPVNERQVWGKVIVKVCVDRNGNIISVKGNQQGSSTTDAYLNQLSETAARKFRFQRIGIASQVNCGFITFNYKQG